MHALVGYEVRYEATFLRDLKHLEPLEFGRVRQFVFEEVYSLVQLQDLPEFRQLDSSDIFYRFTLDRYLISLEITGSIVKFLRVLPMPEV